MKLKKTLQDIPKMPLNKDILQLIQVYQPSMQVELLEGFLLGVFNENRFATEKLKH